jgi:hypothetical protein
VKKLPPLWFHSRNIVDLFRAASKMPEESNDEIKAWREERRRNYPTRSNIQRKVIKKCLVRFFHVRFSFLKVQNKEDYAL